MRFLLLITLFSWFQLIDAYRTMCRRKRYQLTGATLRASSMYRPRVLSSQFWKNRCLVISVLVGALLILCVTLGYVCTPKDPPAPVFDRTGYRREIRKAPVHSPPLPTFSREHFAHIVEILTPTTSNKKQFKRLLTDLGVSISGSALDEFLKGANWKLVNFKGKFFKTTLPFIKELVIDTEKIFPDANTVETLGPLSTYESEKTVVLSRRQCACLHANGFFRLLRETRGMYPQESNFATLLSLRGDGGYQSAQYFAAAVLYFQKLASRKKDDAVLDQKVRFTRRSITDTEFGNVMASNAKKPLSEVFMHKNSEVIEDAPDGVLRVDFADRYPGGGFYHGLRTQEEALFAQHPEAAISMYISARLEDNEVILIRGARRFSKLGVYSGDSRVYDHKKTFDEHEQTIAVMDALDLKTNLELFPEDYQYTVKGKRRELLKAFLGFSYEKFGDSGVATGQWGGAEFGGDSKLKALLQLLAASYAGKSMHYYPFDGKGPKDVGDIRDQMDKKGWRAGDLWNWLMKSEEKSDIFNDLRKTLKSSN
eukprot:939374_1